MNCPGAETSFSNPVHERASPRVPPWPACPRDCNPGPDSGNCRDRGGSHSAQLSWTGSNAGYLTGGFIIARYNRLVGVSCIVAGSARKCITLPKIVISSSETLLRNRVSSFYEEFEYFKKFLKSFIAHFSLFNSASGLRFMASWSLYHSSSSHNSSTTTSSM